MSEKISPKPNIAQLEDLANQTEEGEIEVLPNGDVVRLSMTERLEKDLRLVQETNTVLRGVIKDLRARLKEVADLAGKAVG